MDEKTKELIARASAVTGEPFDDPTRRLVGDLAAALAAQAQEVERLKVGVFDFADDTYTQRDQWRQRAEAAEAEVKRITQMAIGSIYAEWERRVEGAEARVRELEAQLPAEMKDCTIRFKECEKGHGRLTADNWVDPGCHWCELDAIEAKTIGRAEEAVRVCAALDENGYICEKAKAITSIRALAKNPAET